MMPLKCRCTWEWGVFSEQKTKQRSSNIRSITQHPFTLTFMRYDILSILESTYITPTHITFHFGNFQEFSHSPYKRYHLVASFYLYRILTLSHSTYKPGAIESLIFNFIFPPGSLFHHPFFRLSRTSFVARRKIFKLNFRNQLLNR